MPTSRRIHHDILHTLLPGTVRLSLMLYDPRARTYRSIEGMGLAGIKIRTHRELFRLWELVEYASYAGWRDSEMVGPIKERPRVKHSRARLAARKQWAEKKEAAKHKEG